MEKTIFMSSWMLAVSFPKNNSGNENDDDITVIPPTDEGGGNDDIIVDPPLIDELPEPGLILSGSAGYYSQNSLNINSLMIQSNCEEERLDDFSGEEATFIEKYDILFTGFSDESFDEEVISTSENTRYATFFNKKIEEQEDEPDFKITGEGYYKYSLYKENDSPSSKEYPYGTAIVKLKKYDNKFYLNCDLTGGDEDLTENETEGDITEIIIDIPVKTITINEIEFLYVPTSGSFDFYEGGTDENTTTRMYEIK